MGLHGPLQGWLFICMSTWYCDLHVRKSMRDTVTCKVYAWLIIMGFGLEIGFLGSTSTITLNYNNSSQSVTASGCSVSSWITSVFSSTVADYLVNSCGWLFLFFCDWLILQFVWHSDLLLQPRENCVEITASKGSTSCIRGNRALKSPCHWYASNSANYTACVA
jgi:hypothetical protein